MKSHLVGFYTSCWLFQSGCCSICAFHGDVKVFVPSCAGCVLAWLLLIIRWFPTITSNQQEELLMLQTGSAFIVKLSVLVLVSVIQVKYSVLTELLIRQLSYVAATSHYVPKTAAASVRAPMMSCFCSFYGRDNTWTRRWHATLFHSWLPGRIHGLCECNQTENF